MTDEQIIDAVRSGTHTLVPMPGERRKFFVGYIKDADIDGKVLKGPNYAPPDAEIAEIIATMVEAGDA